MDRSHAMALSLKKALKKSLVFTPCKTLFDYLITVLRDVSVVVLSVIDVKYL